MHPLHEAGSVKHQTTLPTDSLRLSPARPRDFRIHAPATLLAQVKKNGVLLPIPVRPTRHRDYEILAYPELWHCAARARLDAVPVSIVRSLSDEQAQQIVDRTYRAAFETHANPIEQAEAFAEQLEALRPTTRHPLRLLAAITGHKAPYLSHAMRLLLLPDKIQDLIRDGSLPARHARCLVTLPSARAQIACAEQIVRRALSAREAEALAKRYREGRAGASRPTVPGSDDPDIRKLEQYLAEATGAVAEIRDHSVTLRCANLEALNALIERIANSTPRASPWSILDDWD